MNDPGGAVERRFLVFQVAGAECALAAESVQEILPMMALARLPGQPPVLEGFLNLRGRAIPAVSVRRLFDLAWLEPGMFTPLVVVHSEDVALALIVDRVDEIATVPAASLRPVSGNHSFNDCAEAHFTAAGRTVVVLSPLRLLLAEERHCIAELQQSTQRRLDELAGARS